MNITSMPPLAHELAADPADDKMDQIRELLVGDLIRSSSARIEMLEARIKDLEIEVTRRFEALVVRIDALAGEMTADNRASFDELSRGVIELGERIRHLSRG
jgi:hypothetical protein